MIIYIDNRIKKLSYYAQRIKVFYNLIFETFIFLDVNAPISDPHILIFITYTYISLLP